MGEDSTPLLPRAKWRVRVPSGEAMLRPKLWAQERRSNPTITQAPNKNAPVGGGFVWWRVRDSNPRRLSRLIYSQIPLAARVTRRLRTSAPLNNTGRSPAVKIQLRYDFAPAAFAYSFALFATSDMYLGTWL